VPAPKKAGEDQAIGRSRGGLSTKIHALVDALGNPIGFLLTGGEAHDLVGADHLVPEPDGQRRVGHAQSARSEPRDHHHQAGAANNDVINLGAGTDTVVLGGTGETVNGGGGMAFIDSTTAFAGALVNGGSGTTTLKITTGGTATLNASDSHLIVDLRGAKVWGTPHFFLASIRRSRLFASCAAAARPFRADPRRA
jgi:hypothetical protein